MQTDYLITELFVGKLPGRKNPAIWVREDGAIRILAHFKGETELDDFVELIRGKKIEYQDET